MAVGEFLGMLMAFPTNVFFIPFVVFFLIMLIDLVFNVVEGFTADLDIFDLDNIPGAGLLLPQVLSKVPLMVALCVSCFIATVMSFYSAQMNISLFSGVTNLLIDLASIPIVAYLSLAISALLLKPLAPLFDRKKAFAQVDYIGLKARVHSNVVNKERGEVVVLHQGNEFLLDVMLQDESTIQYGEEVVIVFKDDTSNRYVVAKA
ncbi:DUF1449 domain-containing protein [Enterovibrio sp. ZSDZ42]|uniref:DUF1449 domain-containing protein n=1 Tax=Enterovibrio gelatinilyticus TaxID=2899819 RepID=A0ABT5R4X7_9GAMM|nr:DUF1449 domain-containing protein [Enterovibrio sp. ZSDZ42]MDD1795338.1 DUF1449 domain-containing protein [Enterovibrio sp. ZSDZ42]